MPVPYQPDAPDSQAISLTFSNGFGVQVRDWLSYDFASDFLTPTDSFSFQIGAVETGLEDELRQAIQLGAPIQLRLEQNLLATGLVDHVEVSADRSSGTVYSIHGRDMLGQALDAVADPTFQLKQGGTLGELLKAQFAQFGWSEDADFELDNDTNRDARVGKRGTKTARKKGTGSSAKRRHRRKGRSSGGLNNFVLHQTKPYNHESVFHFCSRVAQRHGLWIWCSADGQKIICSQPDYDQEPEFTLLRGRDGRGNILSGSVNYNLSEQPAIIIADGFSVGGSGEYEVAQKGRVRSYIINPMLGLKDDGDPIDEVAALLLKHKGAIDANEDKAAGEHPLALASLPFRTAAGVPFRPMFLHDDESKNQTQINRYVKREMSLLYRKTMTAHYVVEGHGQATDDGFVAWAPDTVVDVQDEIGEVRERMYVLGVAFNKSRRGGTTTKLELIRLNSIVF